MISPDPHFLTTRWTQVLAAQGDSTNAGAALADLCVVYYRPVEAYITRTSHDLGDARDLTQEFFARLLAGRVVTGALREKGRFRAYLLGAVKHYLADTRDRHGARKRGQQHEHLPLLAETQASPGRDVAAADAQMADAWFDRQWGLTVLERGLSSLRAEYQQQDKAETFELQKPWLTGDADELSQATVAAQLGITEGALKVAIHRMRRRFRDLVKAEIAQTVPSEQEARRELRYLIEVVS